MEQIIKNFIKEIDVLRKRVNKDYLVINQKYHQIATEKMDLKFEEYLEKAYDYDKDIDYDQFVDDIIDFGVDEYRILKLMSYRNISNWICCAIELWEQQLYIFLKEIKPDITPKENWFSTILNYLDDIYKNIIKSSNQYLNLKNKRTLVNVLKHGEIESVKELKLTNPKYFDISNFVDNYDGIELYNSSLTDVALNIDGNDFNETCDQIIDFWEYVKSLNN